MENNQTVEINKGVLIQQVDAGMKKKDLAKHYGISELQMTKALKQAGLTIRKFHHAKFKLVDDTSVQNESEVLVDNNLVNTTTTDDVKEDAEIIQEDTAQADINQVDDTENNEEENNNNTAEEQVWY